MINKIINSEDPKFQSETISELVFDTTPTVNSFNTVTSDGVARAIAGASGEVPHVTENDNGKVLTAVYDAGGPAVEWAEAAGGLPDTTGASQGDVLTVGSSGPEWAAAPTELPASLGTAGQVLTVNSGATGVEWKNPSSSSDVFVVSRQDATTYADTLAAYNAGKYLYAKYMYNTMFAFFDKYVPQNSGATPEGFYFYWLDMNGNNMILNRWVLKPDNQWDTAAWEFTGSSM